MDLGIAARQAELAEVTARLADESEITDERDRLLAYLAEVDGFDADAVLE